jgi:ACS family glucarate transporter-like MFS transporter
VLSVAAKPIAAEFHLGPVQKGYLFSSFLWTYLLFLIPSGILADKYGARGVCAGGMGVWSIATVFTGLVGSFPAFFRGAAGHGRWRGNQLPVRQQVHP